MSTLELQNEITELKERRTELEEEISRVLNTLADFEVQSDNAQEVNEAKVKIFDTERELNALNKKLQEATGKLTNMTVHAEISKPTPVIKHETQTPGWLLNVDPEDTNVEVDTHERERDFQERSHRQANGTGGKAPRFRKGDDFTTFLQRFVNHARLSGLCDNLDLRFSSLVEDNSLFKKISSFQFTALERRDIHQFTAAIRSRLFPPTDTRIMKTKFGCMKQQAGESVGQFAERIKDEADVIFSSEPEREGASVTTFITGLSDPAIKRRLLQLGDSEGGLDHVIRIAVQEENISQALEEQVDSSAQVIDLSGTPLFGVGTDPLPEQRRAGCQKCGRTSHVTENCWSGVTCQLCGKTGHIARVCRELRTSSVANRDGYRTAPPSSRAVVCYGCQQEGHFRRDCPSSRRGTWQNQGPPRVGNQDRAIPDRDRQRNQQNEHLNGGSAVSIVSTGLVKKLGFEKDVKPCNLALRSFTQDPVPVKGRLQMSVVIAGCEFSHAFIVTDLLDTDFLIGDDFLRVNRISLDYNKCRLVLADGRRVNFTDKPNNIVNRIKVRCNKVTTIPPNTAQFVGGKIQAKSGKYQGIMEPHYRHGLQSTGILLASAVVHTRDKFVPVKCVNATDEPLQIFKNTVLGHLTPLGDHRTIHGVKIVKSGGKTTQSNVAGIQCETGSSSSPGSKGSDQWTKADLFNSLKLGEIEAEMTDSERKRMEQIIWEYRGCFSRNEFDIGCCTEFEAEIKLKEGASPAWTAPIPTPYKLRQEMDRQIDQMVKAGVVEPLYEASEFNSPIFLVKKNTPNSWRLVADLRNLNKVCLDEKYPLPNLNHVLDTIGADTLFSSFDLSKSFWQVPYSEKSKKMTAFLYRGKSYCWARMIMGHKNSSSAFSKMMYKLLATIPIDQLIFFIDDLFLSSTSVHDHLNRLEILLSRLMRANLKLTPGKCELLRKKVTFVGVSVNDKGIQITDDRIRDLLDLPVPTTSKRVQEVLGALNYVRKWIPNYSSIARPLHQLTAKGTKFEWSVDCQRAFEDLKNAVAKSTVLAIPDTSDPYKSYQVQVDASKHGYGATLSQELLVEGRRQRRVVAFFSKAVPQFKRERSQTQLEFDAMVLAIQHWKMYLRNTEFKVLTDCKSLLSATDSLFSKSDPSLIRKCQELANFNFSIEHVEGKKNTLCDFLSRFPFRRKTSEVGCQANVTNADKRGISAIDKRGAKERAGRTSACHQEDEVSGTENGNSSGNEPEVLECEHVDAIVSGADRVLSDTIESVTLPESGKDSGLNLKQEATDLQLLFEQEHEGTVMLIDAKPELQQTPICVCNFVEPQQRKVPKPGGTVTFAMAESDPAPITQVLPDLDVIRREQEADPILKVVKSWVVAKQRGMIQVNRTPDRLLAYWKQFNLLVMEDGLLKRKWVMRKEEETRYLILVPERCEEDIMRLFHENITSCHPGASACVTKCRQYFYWPKMEAEFDLFVKGCVKCGQVKPPRAYLKAPLNHIIFHAFNDAIVVDHVVPSATQRTPRGYRYILTITDAWSNYVVAVPVRTQTAKENIAAIMKHWVWRFGVCREIIVDNHPGFRAEFFQEVWRSFECTKTHGTSYKSASTGRAENNNKRINIALRTCLPVGKEHLWDVYLDKVTFALNCAKNRRTGFTAHKMVFGREVNLPLTLVMDAGYEKKPRENSTVAQAVYKNHQELKKIIRKVRKQSRTDFIYAAKQHDRNLHGPYFKEGDLCFVLIQCPKHKFDPKFHGPFRISKVINDHLYVVDLGKGVEKVVNISKLKHFVASKYSRWKQSQQEPERSTERHSNKESDTSSSSDEEEVEIRWNTPRSPKERTTEVRGDTTQPRSPVTVTPSPVRRRLPTPPISVSTRASPAASSGSGRSGARSPVEDFFTPPGGKEAAAPPDHTPRLGGYSLRPRSGIARPDYYRS
ncbi:hypothetical protein ACHWQZ_G019036 [Mnemiopsis leidyi]